MLSVLMTVYNEAQFVEYAVQSCLDKVDQLVIVEGAYQETIALGASPRSTDGTLGIVERLADENEKITLLLANERTDKDQRNVGLEKIKETNPHGWLLIVDGDEVYEPNALKMVILAAHNMEKSGNLAAYFRSLTFVNDFEHFTPQDFPRLFRVSPQCLFVNDNFMDWPDLNRTWWTAGVVKLPHIGYFHYAFCKPLERFELKKKWWETRFGKDFDYGWRVKKDDKKIEDPNHKIQKFTGKHPIIMLNHPMQNQ